MPLDKQKILAGRKAVDAYRESHSKLHHTIIGEKIFPIDHTAIRKKLDSALKEQGFNSIQEFFDASRLLNIQGLGLDSKELTELDFESLEEMWH